MKKFFLFAAAMLCLVACNKENANEPNAPKKIVTLTASVDINNGAAKAPRRILPNDLTAGEISFHWEEGDEVYVSSDYVNYNVFTLIPGSISADGKTAQFAGEPLDDMSEYSVMYGESWIDYFAGESYLHETYVPGTFRPITIGDGSGDAFILNYFGNVLHLSLYGNVKLGRIEHEEVYYHDFSDVLVFPDGLDLAGTDAEHPLELYMSVMNSSDAGFDLRFYDTDGELIMTKSKRNNYQHGAEGEFGALVNFPALEIAYE